MLSSTAVWLSTNVVYRGGRAARDGAVAVDELVHDAAERLDAQRQRHHVEQQQSPPAAGEDVGLHGRAQRHHLVGVQLGVRRAAEELLDPPADVGDARRAADQHDLVDLLGRQLGVAQGGPALVERAVDERLRAALRTRARVNGAAIADAAGRQVDRATRRVSADDRAILARSAASRRCWSSSGSSRRQVDAHFRGRDVHQGAVEVVAAEVGVAVGAEHLEDAVGERQDRAVEGAAAEVVDGDGAGAAAGPARRPGRRRSAR